MRRRTAAPGAPPNPCRARFRRHRRSAPGPRSSTPCRCGSPTDGVADEANRRDRPARPPARDRGPGRRQRGRRWATSAGSRRTRVQRPAPRSPVTTEVGLPRRRPAREPDPVRRLRGSRRARRAAPRGAPPAPAVGRARAARAPGVWMPTRVRGRLSSYQRGLTSARRARHLPANGSDGLLSGGAGGDNDPGARPGTREDDCGEHGHGYGRRLAGRRLHATRARSRSRGRGVGGRSADGQLGGAPPRPGRPAVGRGLRAGQPHATARRCASRPGRSCRRSSRCRAASCCSWPSRTGRGWPCWPPRRRTSASSATR